MVDTQVGMEVLPETEIHLQQLPLKVMMEINHPHLLQQFLVVVEVVLHKQVKQHLLIQ